MPYMVPMLEFEGILRRNQALQELLELARTVVADGEGASPEEWGEL